MSPLFAFITQACLVYVELLVTFATPALPGCKRFIPMWLWCRFWASYEMFLSYFHFSQLLQPSKESPSVRQRWTQLRVRSRLLTSFHLKRTLVPFPAPLVWFISTSMNASITHGCIPKHTDQDPQKHLVQSSPSENIKNGIKSQEMLDSTA